MQPDYSPDGRRLALAAAGPSGLGVRLCGADGADCVDFESEDNLATPQWSPDGRSLAAVGWQGERPLDVYRLEVEGRFVRRLTTDGAVDTMPTWSRDGRWLYFVSDRSGAFELWKMPSTGGEARQLTHGGAGRAYETSDGRSVYFTNGVGFGSLWRMPAEGGVGTLVLDQRIHHARWTLWRDRVVYVDEPGAGGPHRVAMFDPTTRRDTTLASLDRPSASGIAVSPDGAWILYAQTDRVTSDILTLEGLW
jgi:Tol biopolymer transport system component